MPMPGYEMPMYQMPISQEQLYYNDNRSLYSASTQLSSQTANINQQQGLKKKLNEEINNVLSGCIENIIPKLVGECAENIYMSFTRAIQASQ
jgi:hypothetical protein